MNVPCRVFTLTLRGQKYYTTLHTETMSLYDNNPIEPETVHRYETAVLFNPQPFDELRFIFGTELKCK